MVIDEALVLVDGAGNTNVMDMGAPTTGGHNNVSGWLNVTTTAASGTVTLEESADGMTYTAIPNASWTITAPGAFSVPMPKTSERFVQASLSGLTPNDTAVFVGGLAYEKELA